MSEMGIIMEEHEMCCFEKICKRQLGKQESYIFKKDKQKKKPNTQTINRLEIYLLTCRGTFKMFGMVPVLFSSQCTPTGLFNFKGLNMKLCLT